MEDVFGLKGEKLLLKFTELAEGRKKNITTNAKVDDLEKEADSKAEERNKHWTAYPPEHPKHKAGLGRQARAKSRFSSRFPTGKKKSK
jgi:hypothetical protein